MRRLPGTEEMASAIKNTCRSCRGLELVSQHSHQGAGSQLELYLWRESMPLAAVGACIHALTYTHTHSRTLKNRECNVLNKNTVK